MVMAGTEGVSGPTTDETLSSRLQWLRQRREALQDKLAQKNNELKTLCIEEAELTGFLPPEIPLEPGESPPNFRKRVSTSFNYPQNLINKLKTNGAQEESDLELERQVQINKAETALAILNDANESKAVRRKNRSIYQQSQRRLQELNAQLNFIRQSHGGAPRQSAHIPLHSSQPHLQTTTKHRTKKPRPPLDTSGKDLSPKVESRNFLQEGGISLSPLGPEHNYNSYAGYEFQDLSPHGYPQPGSSNSLNQNRATYHAPSPVDHRRSSNPGHDINVNNNVYVPPDNFRSRAYSQGGNSNSSVSPHHHVPDRMHRPVPNTYTEEERQMHYRQLKLKKQEAEDILRNQQYSQDPRYPNNEMMHRRSAQIAYHETDFSAPRYDTQMSDYPVHYHHNKAPQPLPILRHRDIVDNAMISPEHKGGKAAVDAYIPPGHWMRLDDDIVWCSEDQMNDRFGSLDRRKQNIVHHPSNAETQSRYHTVALGGKNNVAMTHSRPYPLQPQVQSPDTIKSNNNRILLRTQSLGSVETWQPGASSHDGSSIEGRESADGGSSSRNSGVHPSSKPREKEWYETSLDSAPSQPSSQQQQRAIRRAHHTPTVMGPPLKDRAPPVRSNSIPSNRRVREQLQAQHQHQMSPPPPPPPMSQQQQQQQQQAQVEEIQQQMQAHRPPIPQSRFVENRVLEIPAESKPSPGSQENGNESIIPLNSPTNHTVVQPGKYQPYREVTKPFEMSDFYKYSTKFRKRVEANATNEQQQQQQSQQPPANLNTQNDQNQSNNSMQRMPQPVQRNTCPPYTLR